MSSGTVTPVKSSVASQGIVSEVDLTGDEPLLMLGPLGVPLSKAQLDELIDLVYIPPQSSP